MNTSLRKQVMPMSQSTVTVCNSKQWFSTGVWEVVNILMIFFFPQNFWHSASDTFGTQKKFKHVFQKKKKSEAFFFSIHTWIFEEPFKGHQLKGFPLQTQFVFSEEVFQSCVCKCIVRGKLQMLFFSHLSSHCSCTYPLIPWGGLMSLRKGLPYLLLRIFPTSSDSWLRSVLFCERLASPRVTVRLQQTGLYGLGYSTLIDRQTDGL